VIRHVVPIDPRALGAAHLVDLAVALRALTSASSSTAVSRSKAWDLSVLR
jgi:hypothetical protein